MGRINRYLTLFRIFIRGGGYARAEYLKKKHYFKSIGEHCYLQPWNFGTEPYMISFGNNVHIASGVTFVNHDITALMFRYMDNNPNYQERKGQIAIGDNVFVGANSTLLYDIKIGNNVIIGAGSLVNRDIPDGSVAAGVPCRVVGKFEDYKEKVIKSSLITDQR